MPMDKKGLTKLVEECGELTQIAAKKMAYMNLDVHPDNGGSMKQRLEEEMGDVMAAVSFVIASLGLDNEAIMKRADEKTRLFVKWENHEL